jgi:hypothetical protein
MAGESFIAPIAPSSPQPATEPPQVAIAGFFNRPWVQNVLPLATSLTAHAGLAVLAVALIAAAGKVARVIDDTPAVDEQIIVPDSPVFANQPAAAIPQFDSPAGPMEQARQDKIELPTAVGTSQTPSPDINPGGGSGSDADSASAALMLGRGNGGRPGSSAGPGLGDNIGSGTGGLPANFGSPTIGSGDGRGISPIFCPPGGNARKIVFVCDATGTMINKMSVLKRELTTAVGSLRNGTQSYKVIFFVGGGSVATESKNGLIVGSTANKKQTFDWLTDVTPEGTTDPVPALQAAFKLQPDLIYFLSDGEFNNLRSYSAVLEEVDRLHQATGSRVKVNTILFETFEPDAEKAMQTISDRTGGRFLRIGLKDLERDD